MLEGSEIQNVFVDSFPAKLYLGADGVNRLFCIKEDDYYWIAGPVSSEELIQIAESIGVQPTK